MIHHVLRELEQRVVRELVHAEEGSKTLGVAEHDAQTHVRHPLEEQLVGLLRDHLAVHALLDDAHQPGVERGISGL